MDAPIKKAIADVINACAAKGVYKASKYLSEKLVVRASRRLYRGKLPGYNEDFEVIVIVGTPNYEQRAFIKACKKAGEPFPVKKVQIKYPPKKR